jgi:hypothetical protein
MAHSPALRPPYGRPETSQLLKVDHYMLLVRMRMRLGGWAASSQNTDTDTGVGVVRSSWGRSVTRGSAVLTQVCVQADSNRCPMCKLLRAVESPLRAYNDLLGGFEELDCIVPQGRQRNRGFSSEKISGVSDLPCPLQNTPFLSQPPDQRGHYSAVAVCRLSKPHC